SSDLIHQRENNEGAKDASFAVGNVMCAITSPFYARIHGISLVTQSFTLSESFTQRRIND
ncbi:hypothetical protein, partial [Escherichia coli]|uniref:hypothetical protein n=1 Tax=Escherichia coli TaxID=562 RepID=UPI001BC8C82A